MNQILSVENVSKTRINKKSNNGPTNISTILKVFSICLMIFGVTILGSGSYSMYKDSQAGISGTKPSITVNAISESQVSIKVKSKKKLSAVNYKWTNKDGIDIECNNKKSITQTIDVPTGTNTLTVTATDVEGQNSTYSEKYTLIGDISIDVKAEGNSIKITASGKSELSYMTYRWDEEDEEKIEINNISTEQIIEAPKGLHKLTVVVVDINNQSETKEQEINGVTKPKMEITTDGGDNFIIIATDEQGLEKVEFIINENEKYKLNLDGRTELEYAYPLHDGENRLEVRIYNINGISDIQKVLVNK